jgi:tRNA(Ile)-lysidine synthase
MRILDKQRKVKKMEGNSLQFYKKVENYIHEQNMLSECEVVVAGLSGGADSVCLLKILKELSKKAAFKCVAVHINHGLRGEEAKHDEEFAATFCKENSIEFIAVHKNVGEIAKKEKMTCEEAGRKVRYDAFKKVADDYRAEGKKVKIAVAHNMNDNAETILFNLIRGTGIDGLCGIRATVNDIIRPLLCVSRSEIEEFLNGCNQDYVIDSTNLTLDYTRNVIRNKIIPIMEESVNSQTIRHISGISEFAIEDRNYINKKVEYYYTKLVENDNNSMRIRIADLNSLDDVIKKGVVRKMISLKAQSLKDVSQIHVQNIIDLAGKGTGHKLNLPYGICVITEYEYLRFQDNELSEVTEGKVEVDITSRLKNAKVDEIIQIELGNVVFEFVIKQEIDTFYNKNSYTKCFDYDKIKDNVFLRNRKKGDYIVINKDGSRKKLKDYFINAKIPSSVREELILLAHDSSILWVPGRRTGEGCQVTENTKNILVVKYV